MGISYYAAALARVNARIQCLQEMLYLCPINKA